MATSGTVSTTTFNTRRVIDTAFRRCRLLPQTITPEMQEYANDALYLFLSELANNKPPSWCIEEFILPMYENQPVVTFPTGTVDILNLNYRTFSELEVDSTNITQTTILYEVDFEDTATVNSVGVKWTGASVDLSFDVSDDATTWVNVGSQTTTAASGEWTWTDISAAKTYQYFRITSTLAMDLEEIYLGTGPSETPIGNYNRDTYSNQTNKVFPGRPTSYWFQRDLPLPVINLWPAPNAASEHAQLTGYRHRHIMDVGTLQNSIEVPQRWMEAIVANLSSLVGAETPQVDTKLLQSLELKAERKLQTARDGDNDGSSTFISPQIGVYTR